MPAAIASTFVVEDIHRKTSAAVVVVGVQDVDGKVWPASLKISRVMADASARELAKFFGAQANVDAKGFVVSFSVNSNRFAEIIDIADLAMRERENMPSAQAPAGERVDAFDVLGLATGGKDA